MGTTAQKLQAVLASKAAIKSAIETKGVSGVGNRLSEYAAKIAEIPTGSTGGWFAYVNGSSTVYAYLNGNQVRVNSITNFTGEATLEMKARSGFGVYCEVRLADGTTHCFPESGGRITLKGPCICEYAYSEPI